MVIDVALHELIVVCRSVEQNTTIPLHSSKIQSADDYLTANRIRL